MLKVLKIGQELRLQGCLKCWNKDSYLHTRKCKSLAASHCWYDWARDTIIFSFDQKYESNNENDKKLKIDPWLRLWFPKTPFLRHSVQQQLLLFWADCVYCIHLVNVLLFLSFQTLIYFFKRYKMRIDDDDIGLSNIILAAYMCFISPKIREAAKKFLICSCWPVSRGGGGTACPLNKDFLWLPLHKVP